MKVLNLQCSHQHAFEGWFGSEDDFQSQLTRGLVSCPLCGDPVIQKMPSAPRLNFGASAALPEAASTSREVSVPATPRNPPTQQVVASDGHSAGQAEFLKALRHVLAHTEDVGERFADEARAMHYGDAEHRNIRGQASRSEAMELLEEGIEVMPLPLPAAVKETLQ
ncbi:DUF1178 family protein [Polaromonas sp.]|uniref:DUF1178 family protein n=1 Tax=Polaromonas sp. TaxID=1869339 RepID=UPI00272F6A30|nr:DUF1178 family protein [Polaromonas sp.]MDP1739824.1 DUF1178 family protein [Polaromonas sp.]